MGLSRSRTVTLVVAVATLTSNTLSSVLFAQLPDDPYHLASNFGWYLHFANILSVFGFIGALRQHALSITIFANYLILDTLLCSIPRFLLLGLLDSFSSTLCASPSSFPFNSAFYTTSKNTNQQPYPNLPVETQQISQINNNAWSEARCIRLLELAQFTLAAGVIAATVLQFVGALCVREYGKVLWVRELREEGILVDLGVQEILERGEGGEGRDEGRFKDWVEKEERRKERLVEEWGFGGLEVIVEEVEDVGAKVR